MPAAIITRLNNEVLAIIGNSEIREQLIAQGLEPVGSSPAEFGAQLASDVAGWMSHRATVLYFALTQLMAIDRVRVYDGSWTEWGNLVGMPVER